MWDSVRLYFVGWCRWYHSIHGAEEPPSNAVIEDDEKLDEWMRLKEIEANKARQEYKRSVKQSSSSHPRTGTKLGSASFGFDFSEGDD